MIADFKTLQLEYIDSGILVLTLNRPAQCNAINSQMMQDLYYFWQKVLHEKNLRCIIITGKGNAFCAGADLKERKDLDVTTWKAQHLTLVKAIKTMLQCPVPVIAAVNGAAFGGGLELALASDFAYAADTATFGQSELKVGIMPGAFGTQHLPLTVGLARAKELIFTGQTFDAQAAYTWGIINKITLPHNLIPNALICAKQIIANAPCALRAAKEALNASKPLNKRGYAKELACYHKVLNTEDRVEGIKAFNEKRVPIFKGE